MDVTLCLTHACNLRCGYCYAGRKFRRRMSWDTARRALDFAFTRTRETAAKMSREPVCQLGFFGGEPLLEWDLLSRATGYALEESNRLGIRLKRTVTTNLTLLDEAKADWLRDQGFHVGLSIDGNAAMHDTMRRTVRGGSSHAACAGALRFFRGPEANGEAIIVLDPCNIHHLADSVGWLIGQGIRRISLNPNFTAGWTEETLAIWRDAYHRIGDIYAETFRSGDPVHINLIDGKIRARINGGYRPCDRCGFGESEISVSAAGFFYPCERLVGDDTHVELRIGDVKTGFYPDARQRILSSRGNQVAECVDCSVRSRCVNWCGCVNYASTGFINQVPAIVCHHEKLSIQTADRIAELLFSERNPFFLQRFYGHLGDLH